MVSLSRPIRGSISGSANQPDWHTSKSETNCKAVDPGHRPPRRPFVAAHVIVAAHLVMTADRVHALVALRRRASAAHCGVATSACRRRRDQQTRASRTRASESAAMPITIFFHLFLLFNVPISLREPRRRQTTRSGPRSATLRPKCKSRAVRRLASRRHCESLASQPSEATRVISSLSFAAVSGISN